MQANVLLPLPVSHDISSADKLLSQVRCLQRGWMTPWFSEDPVGRSRVRDFILQLPVFFWGSTFGSCSVNFPSFLLHYQTFWQLWAAGSQTLWKGISYEPGGCGESHRLLISGCPASGSRTTRAWVKFFGVGGERSWTNG